MPIEYTAYDILDALIATLADTIGEAIEQDQRVNQLYLALMAAE